MTPLEKGHGLFVLLQAQLHDLSPTLEIAVLTSLRALIAEREHDLRNALAAQFPPPPRSEPKHGIL